MPNDWPQNVKGSTLADMLRRLPVTAVIVGLTGVATACAQQQARSDFEEFTRNQPNGLVSVRAMDLPESFVRRVADRV